MKAEALNDPAFISSLIQSLGGGVHRLTRFVGHISSLEQPVFSCSPVFYHFVMVSDLVPGRGPHDRHPVILPPQQRQQGIKTPLKVKEQKGRRAAINWAWPDASACPRRRLTLMGVYHLDWGGAQTGGGRGGGRGMMGSSTSSGMVTTASFVFSSRDPSSVHPLCPQRTSTPQQGRSLFYYYFKYKCGSWSNFC